jgi:hypothetical protein
MSPELNGQIRHVLTSIGGILVGMGYVNSSLIEPAVGIALALVGFIWSYKAKSAGK